MRPILLTALLLIAAGCGSGPSGCAGGSSATPPPAQTVTVPATTGVAVNGQAVTSPGQSSTQQTANQLTVSPFWRYIEETRHSGDDSGAHSSLLQEKLSKLNPTEIVRFHQWYRQLDKSLYSYGVWGAAYVIEDGCSDDCFRDFRFYVISLGHKAYDAAITNPDNLAGYVQDAETGDWENADDVAGEAYSSRTGNDPPWQDDDLQGTPRGQQWNENNLQALLARYPKLAARFR